MKRTLSLALVLALLLIPAAAISARAESLLGYQSLAGLEDDARASAHLAARAINGYYLPCGSRFSFNEAVGEAGGAGVERVATALYNALSGARGIEYAALAFGADGGVSLDGADFSFYNYSADMYIEIYADETAVSCSLVIADEADAWGADSALAGRASLTVPGGEALRGNLELACGSLSDITLGPGDVFSFNEIVGPRTPEYGYRAALNGQGQEVLGGGADLAASALYLAVKDLGSVEITDKFTYGGRYNQSYVASPQDAVLTDPDSGLDFRFTYTGGGALAIYLWLEDGQLVCEVYEILG